MSTPEAWIERLSMVEHPEGGFFRENYRATETISKTALPQRYRFDHSFSTAMYYLLAGADFSAFHRIASDEVWHFYDGSTLLLHMLDLNRGYESRLLGANAEDGAVPQWVVPQGTWMAIELVDKTSFGLVGCTVAPGFDFADFEMARADKLTAQFPESEALISRMTRGERETPAVLDAADATDPTP